MSFPSNGKRSLFLEPEAGLGSGLTGMPSRYGKPRRTTYRVKRQPAHTNKTFPPMEAQDIERKNQILLGKLVDASHVRLKKSWKL